MSSRASYVEQYRPYRGFILHEPFFPWRAQAPYCYMDIGKSRVNTLGEESVVVNKAGQCVSLWSTFSRPPHWFVSETDALGAPPVGSRSPLERKGSRQPSPAVEQWWMQTSRLWQELVWTTAAVPHLQWPWEERISSTKHKFTL